MARTEWLQDMGRDLRFGLRQVRKNPGFSAMVVLTLGLGIGPNTAVFSVANGVLLKPLPYPEPENLVRAWSLYLPESGREGEKLAVSPVECVAYRDATSALENLAYYQEKDVTLTGEDLAPERIRAVTSSSEFLSVLGMRPYLGRWFTKEETFPGGPMVAVLSHEAWETRFGGDPGVVGRVIHIDGSNAQVLGVLPRDFAYPNRNVQIFLPFQFDESTVRGWAFHSVQAVGRMAEGFDLAQAGAELNGLVEFWRQEFGHPQAGHSIYLVPLRDSLVNAVSGTLRLLAWAVALVLLIAAVNVANLLLSKGGTRVQEVALRASLGASRYRIGRQFLAESSVLALLGAGLGLGLAAVGVPALLRLNPDAVPRSESISIDFSVLVLTGGVALVAALLFGLLPALQLGMKPGSPLLVGGSRSVGSVKGSGLRRIFVVSEVALSLMVVICAGLVIRSLEETLRVDTGMEAEGTLTFGLALPSGGYLTPEDVDLGIRSVMSNLESLPGVSSASFTSALPLTEDSYNPEFHIEQRPQTREDEESPQAVTYVVSPGHTSTMGIPLLSGRRLRPGDREESGLVALISREAARVYWPDEEPIGQRIGFSWSGEVPWVTIVGVVEDTPHLGLQEGVQPQIYLPLGQEQGFWGRNPRSGSIALRTSLEPTSLVPAVRRTLDRVDPSLPLPAVRTMEQIVQGSVAGQRMVAGVLGSFGLVALLLAIVGVLGVVSYSVTQRTREIGIRMALGADKGRILGLMVLGGVGPAVIGICVGIPGAWAGASMIESMLFRVRAADPMTFLLVVPCFVVAALLAALIPSWKAARVEPTDALREE